MGTILLVSPSDALDMSSRKLALDIYSQSEKHRKEGKTRPWIQSISAVMYFMYYDS